MSDSIHQFGPEHVSKVRLHARRDELWKGTRYTIEIDMECDGIKIDPDNRYLTTFLLKDDEVSRAPYRSNYLQATAEQQAQAVGKLFASMILEMLEKVAP